MSDNTFNPDLVEMGNLIRLHREKANMTQSELSERANFGEKTLSRLEMGKSNMRVETFFTLSDALGVTPNDISPSRLLSYTKDPRFCDLEARFNTLNEKEKQFIYNAMSNLLNGLQNLC